jgi:tRNA (cytidine/uridine-2'-O-)-methyltransferase
VEPEIPGNTGSLGRTCLALGARLHLIHPLGFDLSEKAVRRAGLDYWKHVDLIEHDSYEKFLESEKPKDIFYFSVHTDKSVFQAKFKEDCYLVFGKESQGLPEEIIEEDKTYKLPIESQHIRSLNLASAATTIGYECYRQLAFL